MKYLGIIFSTILIFALMVGAIIYLSNRFAMYFPAISYKKWLWILGGLLVATMVGQAFSVTPNVIGKYISMFSSLGSAVLLYLVLSIMAIELINLLIHITPLTRGIISISLATIVLSYGIFHSYDVKVKYITIPIKGLKKEIKAVHVTDIHLGNFRGEKFLNQIVDKINALEPDVIFNTGDQFDSKAHFGNSGNNDVLRAFKRLKAPQYFVHGNHDVYVGVDEVIRRMKAAGVIALQNEVSNFGELQIVGLNNMAQDSKTFDVHATPGAETVESVMARLPIDESRPTVVLHHRPEGVEYMDARKAGLLLSGHTHAGQTFPATIIAKLMYVYNSGLYKYNNLNIYVSDGAGTIFAPLRLGTDSEISLIKLIPMK